jgi:hypothetical protein
LLWEIKEMIGANIVGRIGNIMFEVAAIHTLARDNGDHATFPSFESNLRHLDTKDFGLSYKLKAVENYPKIFDKINTAPQLWEKKVDAPTGYGNIEYSPNTLYDGYMQSPLYFEHRMDEIRELFSCPQDIAQYILEKYPWNKPTCFVHVRKGDYAYYPNIHPMMPLSYYEKAKSIIEKHVKPQYLIFSDNTQWCRENITWDNSSVIDEPDYVSIYMMACCDHGITANSSFSLWGSMLSKIKNKIVISPSERRYTGCDIPVINDIIPKSHIQLDEF